jgi:dTMP kinase
VQDRFEQESVAYKHRVQDIYLQRADAEPQRIKLIDASGDIADVSAQVQQSVRAFIHGHIS